jgi:DNA-binding protein HU-beta
MNKGELIQAIADQTGQTKVATEKTLNALLETVIGTVAAGQEVSLVGFGAFKLAQRAARQGRNPATGETIQIAASATPKFVPGLAFKTKVNGA